MPDLSKKIDEKYLEGLRLQEAAQNSDEEIEKYLEAAQCYREVSILSAKGSRNTSNSDDEIAIMEILSHISLCDANSCSGSYYYEMRECVKAISYFERCLRKVSETILLANDLLKNLTSENQDFIIKLLPVWEFKKRTFTGRILASRAREKVDKGDFLNAINLFNRAMDIYKEAYLYANSKTYPNSDDKRIARRNFVAAAGNASRFLGWITLYGKHQERNFNTIIPLIENIGVFIRKTHEAYKAGYLAHEIYPEWGKDIPVAQRCLANIKNFFHHHKTLWGDIYLEFENEPDILKLMKMVDLELYKQIEAKRFTIGSINYPPNDEKKSSDKEQNEPKENTFVHSSDYRIVKKDGKEYQLSSMQSQIIEILHKQYTDNHHLPLSQAYVLEEIGSTCKKLKDIFKINLEAWKDLIESTGKGFYKLKL